MFSPSALETEKTWDLGSLLSGGSDLGSDPSGVTSLGTERRSAFT